MDLRVKEKDELYPMASRRQDLVALRMRLADLAPLWIMSDYHYKGAEICEIALTTLAGWKPRTTNNIRVREECECLFVNMRDMFRRAEAAWKDSNAWDANEIDAAINALFNRAPAPDQRPCQCGSGVPVMACANNAQPSYCG